MAGSASTVTGPTGTWLPWVAARIYGTGGILQQFGQRTLTVAKGVTGTFVLNFPSHPYGGNYGLSTTSRGGVSSDAQTTRYSNPGPTGLTLLFFGTTGAAAGILEDPVDFTTQTLP